MEVAVICVSLLSALLFILGFSVSANRGKSQVLSGYQDNPADSLYKAVRAHGNTIEYVPILAVLMLYLGSTSPQSWIEWTMIIVTVARFLIVAGILFPASMDKPNPMRFIGAVLTYLGGFTLVAATLLTIV